MEESEKQPKEVGDNYLKDGSSKILNQDVMFDFKSILGEVTKSADRDRIEQLRKKLTIPA